MAKLTLPHIHNHSINAILEHMPAIDSFQDSAAIFQQLGDGSRLRILWLLCHCEECVTNIAAAVSMSSAAVSHHLKSLKLHGLINSRREGKEIYYTLSETKEAHLIHQIIDDYFQLSCPNKGLTQHS